MQLVKRVSALIAVVLVVPVLLFAQKQTRTVYVTALDAAGAPALGLTAADFEVKEGETIRPVTFASLMNIPMRIILLIDNSSSAAKYQGFLQKALTDLINKVPEKHEIGIVNLGKEPRIKLAPTTDREKLRKAAGQPLEPGGIAFFDSLRETENRFMKKEGVRYPVYVMFVTEGNEVSEVVAPNDFNKMTIDMASRGTVVYAAAVQSVGPTPLTATAQRFSQGTGGMFLETNVAQQTAFSERINVLADRLMEDYAKASTRYMIEYSSDAKYVGGVDVRILKDNLRGGITMRRIP